MVPICVGSRLCGGVAVLCPPWSFAGGNPSLHLVPNRGVFVCNELPSLPKPDLVLLPRSALGAVSYSAFNLFLLPSKTMQFQMQKAITRGVPTDATPHFSTTAVIKVIVIAYNPILFILFPFVNTKIVQFFYFSPIWAQTRQPLLRLKKKVRPFALLEYYHRATKPTDFQLLYKRKFSFLFLLPQHHRIPFLSIPQRCYQPLPWIQCSVSLPRHHQPKPCIFSFSYSFRYTIIHLIFFTSPYGRAKARVASSTSGRKVLVVFPFSSSNSSP